MPLQASEGCQWPFPDEVHLFVVKCISCAFNAQVVLDRAIWVVEGLRTDQGIFMPLGCVLIFMSLGALAAAVDWGMQFYSSAAHWGSLSRRAM